MAEYAGALHKPAAAILHCADPRVTLPCRSPIELQSLAIGAGVDKDLGGCSCDVETGYLRLLDGVHCSSMIRVLDFYPMRTREVFRLFDPSLGDRTTAFIVD
jgi:hypothetical protein